MITVDIAFAPDSQTQLRLTLQLADDSRVIDAVNATGWQQQYPQIFNYSVGVFSHKLDWQSAINTGDRIEIYRPLTLDPQNKRKLLSKKSNR